MALAGLQANQIITMFDVFSLTQTCSNANAMVATNRRERWALPCPLVSYLYPFPWTDVTVGLKLNMLLSHYSTVGGAQGGCLLKSGSRHIHSSHKRAVKLCLTSLWPCSRVWSSSSPKGNPCLALDICAPAPCRSRTRSV